MKRSHSLIASSSSSCPPQNNYEVFLSFGGDTRNNFTSHLYEALCQNGIHTFLDDVEMERGKAISAELQKAIEGSRCSVVVLSPDYATSRWCLNELVLILQCKEESKQIVLPIFYHVDPSHVRKQSASIGDTFQTHEQVCNLQEVNSWRAALTEVGNLAGYHLQDDWNEAKFIKDFIKVVSRKLYVPNISKDLVGMDSRREELELRVSSSRIKDVRFIGICGMGGLGKTTLARAYFESMSCQFEASSFLANIREVCKNSLEKGLVELQKQLLTDILKGEHDISNVDQGIGMIQKRLRHKKVLVILDDVNQLKQLEGLAEKNHWFGSGSRIILTTRDRSLLKGTYQKEGYIRHEVDKLKISEALHLFSLKAFKNDCPPEDYQALSEKVVEYAKGVPLALEVLGSFLGACESIDEWKSALERLKKCPEEKIMEKLQISFDALKDEEKSIFLDIACFFNGFQKDYIMNIMDGCGFFPIIGIRSLVDKSLLHMDHNTLRMHDLLEEMGKEIVRKESPNEPGRRSRIWRKDDFYHVMNKNTATKKVEAIVCPRIGVEVEAFSLRGFSIMKKLRLFNIHTKLPWSGGENLERLSNELRLLDWIGFPFNSFPPSFQPHGLVKLRLYIGVIEQLWNNPAMAPLYHLKSIDLSCSSIRLLEDFRLFPNLEKLILNQCGNLKKIDQSITFLGKLTLLSLEGCKELKSLPKSMYGLKSLKVLKLSDCKRLGKLPEDLGCLNNLEELHVRGTGIKDIPSSIRDLKALKLLYCSNSFLGRNGLSSAGPYCLKILDLRNCGLYDGAFPDDFGGLVSLQSLSLSGNKFSCLPAHFNRLSKLKNLYLNGCRNLTSLGSELPNSLKKVIVRDCKKLHTFLDPLSQCNLQCSVIDCGGCFKLVERQGGKRTAITSLGRYLQNRPSPSKIFKIIIPGDEIPSWFTRQVWGSSSISLTLDTNWCTNDWMGFALSFCFATNESMYSYFRIKINQEGQVIADMPRAAQAFVIANRHHLLLYLPRTYFHAEWHNKLGDIQFSFHPNLGFGGSKEFKQCGVRLVYEQDIEELNLLAIHEPIELERLGDYSDDAFYRRTR